MVLFLSSLTPVGGGKRICLEERKQCVPSMRTHTLQRKTLHYKIPYRPVRIGPVLREAELCPQSHPLRGAYLPGIFYSLTHGFN